MGWLDYSDDEISVFHPAFEESGNAALKKLNLDSKYAWNHHPTRKPGGIYPDFSLVDSSSGNWVLVVEIKRRKDAVYSTRYQYQAKSYAEENSGRYGANSPRYFAITNLETTLLFALNGNRPPLECQVLGGVFPSGDFSATPSDVHKAQFVEDLGKVISQAVTLKAPTFEMVWPAVLDDMLARVRSVKATIPSISAVPNSPGWPTVEQFFGRPAQENAVLLFLLRCLVAEFLRGTLQRCGHPKAGLIPVMRAQPKVRVPSSIANVVEALRSVDFRAFFEDKASDIYRSISDPALLDLIQSYVSSIVAAQSVSKLARERVDHLEMLDSLFYLLYPLERHAVDGKIQTDPDLASLLATLVIGKPVDSVVDPCCGQGSLVSAAYDRLADLGMSPDSALESLAGIDADEVSAKIASLRLALKNPANLTPNLKIDVFLGDMFHEASLLGNADAILMNPPFKRYEAQDDRPVPPELRQHYKTAICRLTGANPEAVGGQSNLFNYYVEYVVRAAPPKARIGIILDNKWYHSRYGEPLRRLLLEHCRIEAIVEYPHDLYFKGSTIATSIIVLQKVAKPVKAGHDVRFVRCVSNPLESGNEEISRAMHGNGDWPVNWTKRPVPQGELKSKEGWKRHFVVPFENDFLSSLTPLEQMFTQSRRGSLNKEEGGSGIIDFPFDRTNYGPRREPCKDADRRPFQTKSDRPLTDAENTVVRVAAKDIPDDYRGWAIRNADDVGHFVLDLTDVTKVMTIEPPRLRSGNSQYFDSFRTRWTDVQEKAVGDMERHGKVKPFIDALADVVGLSEATLPKNEMWICIREPYAGELIIPRKLRVGHSVYVNPYAFNPSSRQVRISSNFISYSNCKAVDKSKGLDRQMATHLIAAFLVSSFGQVQFEREGYNREGLRCVEKDHLARIRVLDPMVMLPDERTAILSTFSRVPYPVSTDSTSIQQKERNLLDEAIATPLCRISGLEMPSLLDEVHLSIDEWLEARRP